MKLFFLPEQISPPHFEPHKKGLFRADFYQPAESRPVTSYTRTCCSFSSQKGGWGSSNTVSTLTKLITLRACRSQCCVVQLPHLQFQSWDWSESEAIRLKLWAARDVLLHCWTLHLPINTGRGFASLWDTIEIKELSVINRQLSGGIRLKTRRYHSQYRELEQFNILFSQHFNQQGLRPQAGNLQSLFILALEMGGQTWN